jgi:hypothetical protein
MSFKTSLVFCAIFCVLCWPTWADAENSPSKFCILPVDIEPGVDKFSPTSSFDIPYVASPVFTGNISGPVWIDKNQKLTAYSSSYPDSFLDQGHWVEEPWDSRVIAITYATSSISVMSDGDASFRTLFRGPQGFHEIQLLPRRRQTVVVSNNGSAYIVHKDHLSPFLGKAELSEHGIDGIIDIYDAPSLAAIVILDSNGYLYLITDDGSWVDLHYKFENSEFADLGPDIERLYSLPASDATLIFGPGIATVIRHSSTERHSYSTETILPEWFSQDSKVAAAQLFSQMLRWQRGPFYPPRWQLFTHGKFVDTPGGGTDLQPKIVPGNMILPILNITDLPTIRLALLPAEGGILVYNGSRIWRIPDSSPGEIGDLPQVTDVSGIKRVLVTTLKGLYQLTPTAHLVPVDVPFKIDVPYTRTSVTDWPQADVGLVETPEGLFTIDQNLKITPVAGGTGLGGRASLTFRVLGSYAPLHGKVIIAFSNGKNALYILADSALAPANTCSN